MDSPRVALVLASLCWASYAVAQPRENHESDNRAIREAVELRRRHREQDALTALQRIYQETLDTEALGELAQTELALGRYAEAEDHFTEALGAESDPWVQRSHRQLEAWRDEARSHLVTLTVTGTPLGATVKVNQRVLGRLPLEAPLRLLAGTLLLEVEAPGHLPFVRTLELQAGVTHSERAVLRREFEVTPPPSGSVPTSASACQAGMELRDGLCYSLAPPSSGIVDTRVATAMLLSGVSVAALSSALALGLYLDGNSTERDYLSDCGGAAVAPACEARFVSEQASLSGRAAAVNVLWVLATLGVGAAVVGAVLTPRSGRSAPVALRASSLSVVW